MTNIAIPALESVPKSTFRLRWRFDYADGKIKRGVWNGASDVETDQAWRISKDGLIRAAIEGENLRTYEEVVFVEVDGHRYASAQWLGYSKVGNVLGVKHAVTPRAHIGGLSFLTDAEKITAYTNGKVEIRDLTEQEKKFKIHEHRGI